MKTAHPKPPAVPEALARARDAFPVLKREVNGKPLVYLDNAASTQKPEPVIARLDRYYREEHANVHRGVHFLSVKATEGYEAARATAARYLNAETEASIVFTRGATEAVNLVARSFAEPRLQPGDEILVTHMEHHANIVPWQLVCEQTGARLRVAPVNDRAELDVDAFVDLLGERTKLAAFVHVSNATGAVNPVQDLVEAARRRGVPTLIDAAQSVQHLPIDVQRLGCDFLVFSGHKVYGPTGIGALYGKLDRLKGMPPYQGGGDMIAHVSFDGTTFKEPPSRFEAGTPHIAGAIGLAAALEFVSKIGLENIHAYESQLVDYALARLEATPGLRLVGEPAVRSSAISFVMDNAHPHDLGTILDAEGVAVRAGHHCCEPLLKRLGHTASARASFCFYNTPQEADALAEGLEKAAALFG